MGKGRPVDCAFCTALDLSKDIVALNRKLIHRQIERFMCLPCMADYFETTTEDLEDKIEEFKYEGCGLFG